MRYHPDENKLFSYRVAGIATCDNKILIHNSSLGHNWALPGGACEFGENSKKTLERELREELSADVEVGELRFVIENFFKWEGKEAHEIGFYYDYSFVGDSKKLYKLDKFEGQEEFDSIAGNHSLYFEWVDLSNIDFYDFKPIILKKLLKEEPTGFKHVIYYDEEADS